MKENKNARSDVAASEQAKDSFNNRSHTHIKNNSNRRRIQAFLLEGEENALPMRELARCAGISERRLRQLIERERRAGEIILSSDNGYFLPDPDNACMEIRRYIRRVDARMRSTREAARPTKLALKELEAQNAGQTMIDL